ncbi:MAG: biotin--[acetyl-CoA-carboxylase] ligase [Saprospiraceae bacterium]
MHIENTLFVGKVLLHFTTLESTNTYATELLAKSKPIEGTVISTFCQTAGIGQIGSKWESEPNKNLSFSLLLYPTFLAPREQFRLNIAVSLSVQAFIAKYTQKTVKIKWPNDIYVGSRKICGILIQNSITTQALQSSIIGIGVNVNQLHFSENAPNATSLALETNREFPLPELLENLCQQLEKHYLYLKNSQHWHTMHENYLMHLYRYQELADFQRADGSIFQGTITGISESGKLQIAQGQTVEEFAIKEISFL